MEFGFFTVRSAENVRKAHAMLQMRTELEQLDRRQCRGYDEAVDAAPNAIAPFVFVCER